MKTEKNLNQRRNLTAIERERIVQLQDVQSSDKALLGHTIIKYLQFNAENDLNSKGEFYQSYDDIRNTMMSGINDKAIREQLKRLVSVGYITYQYKGIEGDKLHRKAIHLSITDKAIENVMGDIKELEATPKEKYETLQAVRCAVKTKKEFTPEVFNTKIKRESKQPPKPIEQPTTYTFNEGVADDNNNNVNKAKLILQSKKTIPKIGEYLTNLKISNYDVIFLLSDDYDGKDRELNKKKEMLNNIAQLCIAPEPVYC